MKIMIVTHLKDLIDHNCWLVWLQRLKIKILLHKQKYCIPSLLSKINQLVHFK